MTQQDGRWRRRRRLPSLSRAARRISSRSAALISARPAGPVAACGAAPAGGVVPAGCRNFPAGDEPADGTAPAAVPAPAGIARMPSGAARSAVIPLSSSRGSGAVQAVTAPAQRAVAAAPALVLASHVPGCMRRRPVRTLSGRARAYPAGRGRSAPLVARKSGASPERRPGGRAWPSGAAPGGSR